VRSSSARTRRRRLRCGGTIATWTEAGIEVVYCVCTDGQAGGFDPQTPVTRSRHPAEPSNGRPRGRRGDRRTLPGRHGRRADRHTRLIRDIAAVIRGVRPQRVLSKARSGTGSGSTAATPTTSRPARRRSGDFTRRPQCVRVPRAAATGPRALDGARDLAAAHPTSNHAVDVTASFDRKIKAILAIAASTPSPTSSTAGCAAFTQPTPRRTGCPTDRWPSRSSSSPPAETPTHEWREVAGDPRRRRIEWRTVAANAVPAQPVGATVQEP
jgi:LmbE family N-acetylglucosaminyl deacetylase